MSQSAFACFRGAAAVMADDLVSAPSSGITVHACGDAHLVNFGLYASPERTLVFDLNDFDETLPAPFEWDVARLAASAVIAARGNGFSRKQSCSAARATVAAYRFHMRQYAAASTLGIWYERIEAEAAAVVLNSGDRAAAKRIIERTRAHTSERLLAKLTITRDDGTPRIADQPPLVTHIDMDRWQAELLEMYGSSTRHSSSR